MFMDMRHIRPLRVSAPWLAVALAATACGASSATSSATSSSKPVKIGLIVKTDTNPYFVAMEKAAAAEAAKDGATVEDFAGSSETDVETQVAAVEDLVARGASGFLLTANDAAAMTPSVTAARKAGLLAIALDSPLSPASIADATFATDNYLAGELIGEWAAATFKEEGKTAEIGLLDLSVSHEPLDVARNNGFLQGFGIVPPNPLVMDNNSDPRIVATEVTGGDQPGGQTAAEELLQAHPDINLIYTMDEPVAEGALQAVVAAGKTKQITIVTIDGGCAVEPDVASGAIGADAMQFPGKMATLGVDAIVAYARHGTKPKASVDTGTALATASPVAGVTSHGIAWELQNCWG